MCCTELRQYHLPTTALLKNGLILHEIIVFSLCYNCFHFFGRSTFAVLKESLQPSSLTRRNLVRPGVVSQTFVRRLQERNQAGTTSYEPRARSDIPLALSVRIVALRRVRFSLIFDPGRVRAVIWIGARLYHPVPSWCTRQGHFSSSCCNLDGQNMSSSIVTHFIIIWITILRIILAKLLKLPFTETMILYPTAVFTCGNGTCGCRSSLL